MMLSYRFSNLSIILGPHLLFFSLLLSVLTLLFTALVCAALSGFSVPGAVRLARLKDGLAVLELFHGETLAFKDLAITCTVRFLDYFLHKESRRAIILVGEKKLWPSVTGSLL